MESAPKTLGGLPRSRPSAGKAIGDAYPGKGVKRNLLVQTDKNEYECTSSPRFSKTTFLHDSFANVIKRTREGIAGSTDDQIEETDFAFNGDWLFRPKTHTLKDASGNVLRRQWLLYDGQGHGTLNGPGLLTKEEHDSGSGAIGGGNNAVFEYNHDSLTGVGIFVKDPRLCETTAVLDSTKTFPIEVRTCSNVPALNFLMTNTFDARFGVRTFAKDWNNQETRVEVDDFGRITKMTNMKDYLAGSPNGTEKYEYLAWGVPNSQTVTILKTIEHGQSTTLRTDQFFDGFGRIDQTQSDGPAGGTILQQTKFDSRNRVKEIFAPRLLSEATLASRKFEYDALDRQTKITHPDNRNATNTYAPGMITMTDERGKTKIHFIDAFGRLSQVREFNLGMSYDTGYTYDAADQLIQVQNSQNHLTKMEYDRLGRKTAMCDPNMGTDPTNVGACTATAPATPGAWVYTYNKAGDMLTQTDAKNQKLCFAYDELGRPTSKSQGASCSTLLASFTYDNTTISGADFPKGRLTQVSDTPNNVTTRFAYDELGRSAKSERVLLGVTHAMAQTYDALDRIKQEMFPDLDTASYTYDGPWLKTVSGYIDNILYNGRGQKTSLSFFNGVQTTFTYFDQPTDTLKNFRVKRRTTTNSFQDLQYTYDAASNLTSITDSIWTGTRTLLAYDDLNRLTDAQGTFGPLSGNLPTPTSCTNVYNSIGNLTNKCGSAFTYNDASGKHPSVVTFNPATGKTYTYDANGNMLTRGNQTLAWDFENRVTSVSVGGSTTSMEYDYTGMRVKKFAPGSSAPTQYPFTGYEIAPDGTITKFIKIGIETLASKKTPPLGSANKHFYHNDHLGGVNILSSEVGAKEQLTEYDPWGSVSRNEGATPGTPPTVDTTHRFTGQELDPETGLYYYGGRYYDHEISRFVSPDPYVQEPDDPQNLNRYSYVLNSPQDYVDPNGFSFWQIFADIFLSLLGGAGGQASATAQTSISGEGPRTVQENAAAIQSNNQRIETIKANLEQIKTLQTCEDCAGQLRAVQGETENLMRAAAKSADQSRLFVEAARGNTAFRGYEAGAYSEVGMLAGGKLGGVLTPTGRTIASQQTGAQSASGIAVTKGGPEITQPYQRPSGATTPRQRASVQGKPCVDCGQITPRQVADHKEQLVREYYRTGKIDINRMRALDAVQSQCPTCSARQGAEAARYAREMRRELGLDK